MWNSPSHVTPLTPKVTNHRLITWEWGHENQDASSFFHLVVTFQKSSLIFLGFYCTIWEKEIRWFLLGSICKAFVFQCRVSILKKEKLSNNYKVKNTENTQPATVTLQEKNHESAPQARHAQCPHSAPHACAEGASTGRRTTTTWFGNLYTKPCVSYWGGKKIKNTRTSFISFQASVYLIHC